MAEIEIKVPFRPVWTEDAKKFVDRVKKDMGNFGVGGSARGGSGGGLAAGGLAKGAGMAAGIAAVAAAAVAILGHFKSLTSVVSKILKVLFEFLRPIVDVVTLLLLPVLSILKPILMIIRQVMAPFRKAALQLSAEGARAMQEGRTGDAAALFGLSIQTGLAGLSAVITVLLKDVINMTITSIGEFTKIIVQSIFTALAFISPFGQEAIMEAGNAIILGIDQTTKTITNIIDATTGILIQTQALAIQEMAKMFGVDLGTFSKDVTKMINQVVVGEDNSIWKEFQSGLSIIRNDIPTKVNDAFSPVISSIENSLNKIRGLVNQAEKSANSAKSLYSRVDESFFGGFLPGGSSPLSSFR